MIDGSPITQTLTFIKEEWRDVCQEAKPGLTDRQYDEMWDRFIRGKRQMETARLN